MGSIGSTHFEPKPKIPPNQVLLIAFTFFKVHIETKTVDFIDKMYGVFFKTSESTFLRSPQGKTLEKINSRKNLLQKNNFCKIL